jgi:hypothetical protein
MTKPAPDQSAGWEGILDPNETILWQGRPDGSFELAPSMIFTGLFGLAFASFALFWMIGASMAGGIFWMFGLIHFSVGIGLVLGTIFGPSFVRRRSWYTLTDRRAFIARTLPMKGRSIKSYPITPNTMIEFKDGTLPSTFFASEIKRSGKGTKVVETGFERIEDARALLQMIRTIQKDPA